MGNCCESKNNLNDNTTFFIPGKIYNIESPSVKIAIGWDSLTDEEYTLDSSVTALDIVNGENEKDISINILESICFSNPEGLNETVKLYKENFNNDKEVIIIKLDQIPEEATCLAIAINNFKEKPISETTNGYIRIYELPSKKEFGIYYLKEINNCGMLFGLLQKDKTSSKWYFECIASPLEGNTIQNSYDSLKIKLKEYLVNKTNVNNN